MIELRAAALRFASHGYPVFPLRPRSKTPAIATAHPEGDPQRGLCRGECGRLGHGLYDATADPGQVFEWWRRWPMANIGVPCGPASGWLAIDLDGAEGLASWAKLEAEHGFTDTLTVLTGRGRHLLWRWPEGCALGNTSGHLGPRIDSRAIGGYIVAPPSTHPSGQTYRWYPETRPGPNGAQKLPSWLLDTLSTSALAPARPRRAGTTQSAYVVGGVPSGLPRHLQRQAAEAPGRRGRQTWQLVCAAIEWGLADQQVIDLAGAHAPSVEKYGGRLAAEVGRIIGKVRPDHPHEGHPCDTAGCRNAPRWMGVNA